MLPSYNVLQILRMSLTECLITVMEKWFTLNYPKFKRDFVDIQNVSALKKQLQVLQ